MDIAGLHITHIGDDCVLLEPSEGLDPSDPDTYLLPLFFCRSASSGSR